MLPFKLPPITGVNTVISAEKDIDGRNARIGLWSLDDMVNGAKHLELNVIMCRVDGPFCISVWGEKRKLNPRKVIATFHGKWIVFLTLCKHYVMLKNVGSVIYFFDSTGRTMQDYAVIKDMCYSFTSVIQLAENTLQGLLSDLCGPYCLMFAHLQSRSKRYDMTRIIKEYFEEGNPVPNDLAVIYFMCHTNVMAAVKPEYKTIQSLRNYLECPVNSYYM